MELPKMPEKLQLQLLPQGNSLPKPTQSDFLYLFLNFLLVTCLLIQSGLYLRLYLCLASMLAERKLVMVKAASIPNRLLLVLLLKSKSPITLL